MIADELRERRFAPIVRIEVGRNMPREVRDLLMRELSLNKEDVYEIAGDMDLSRISYFANLDRPQTSL